ncbi:MAG: FUSC family protein [Oscillospiraceae bacterium]|nr:FUSC family protein [Oscillospiraceae bacterium]
MRQGIQPPLLEANRILPPLGQRIVKTSAAVFLCLLFYWLRGYRGQSMPTEAAITAIICMQPYVRDSRDYALSRFTGTGIGAFWGLLFLLVFLVIPGLEQRLFWVYALMALGTLASLYSAVLLRRPDTSGLAAIVFLCLVISFPEIEDPLRRTLDRFLGVLLGTSVAIGVNLFHLPRSKNRDLVFFVRTRDLAPDRFSQIPSAARYRLDYLLQDGAKICLISEHAPAFFMLQMNESALRVPLIVMGGAAIYDPAENRYLHVETLRPTDSRRVMEHLDSLGMSYFIYTVRGDKTRIFHRGALREEEQVIYKRMRRSPYRDYLEEGDFAPEEIVYLKLLGTDREAARWYAEMENYLRTRHLRGVLRPEAGTVGISALYIYSGQAGVKQAESRVMALLRQEEPGLRPAEVFLDRPYETEHDAMHLLNRLGKLYEPVRRPWRKSEK